MTLPILQVRKQRPEEIFDLPDSGRAQWYPPIIKPHGSQRSFEYIVPLGPSHKHPSPLLPPHPHHTLTPELKPRSAWSETWATPTCLAACQYTLLPRTFSTSLSKACLWWEDRQDVISRSLKRNIKLPPGKQNPSPKLE